MPIFKTTHNIFMTPDEDELFDPNWMDSNKLTLPSRSPWDYKREMYIEDVDIWEQIHFKSGGTGLYASWSPYAEFYLIINNLYWSLNKSNSIETFYGPGAAAKAYVRATELGMSIHVKKTWVDPEDMWLYE